MEIINLKNWVSDNKAQFLPPICNKMMHNSQLKVMCVGGPNQRKDYHIEEGEEFFYMIKGDMCLKIIENSNHKDVIIKEGEIFLLPARIPHSPQRFENTVGLVIERERFQTETDVLRYFVGESTEVLYEHTFHSVNLGKELPPIINQFFKSEQYKTGVPHPEQANRVLPFELNPASVVAPKPLINVLDTKCSSSQLFVGDFQSSIVVYVDGKMANTQSKVETWFWQINGSSTLSVGDHAYTLNENDTILVPPNIEHSWESGDQCAVVVVKQDGSTKPY